MKNLTFICSSFLFVMASLSEKCIHRFVLQILFHMMSGHRSVVGFFLVCKQRRNSSLSRRSTCNESVLKKILAWLSRKEGASN